jgi:hypothetical protein
MKEASRLPTPNVCVQADKDFTRRSLARDSFNSPEGRRFRGERAGILRIIFEKADLERAGSIERALSPAFRRIRTIRDAADEARL